MTQAFMVLKACPECGHEILIKVTPVNPYPEIGAGHDLEIRGTVCESCGSIVGGQADLALRLEVWDEVNG